jgi:hypothetical protein
MESIMHYCPKCYYIQPSKLIESAYDAAAIMCPRCRTFSLHEFRPVPSIARVIAGSHAGTVGYVTWTDGARARLTPVGDDPLASIDVSFYDIDLTEGM